MNLETTFVRHSAMIAAIVAGSFLSAAQDPPKPAPAPTPTPTVPDTPPATPQAEGDPFGEGDDLLKDAMSDFGPDEGDDVEPSPFDAFGVGIDASLGQPGGTGSFDSTSIANGVTRRIHVDVAADGKAKATISTQAANGDKTETSYEADSMDALKAQVPEVKTAFPGAFGQMHQMHQLNQLLSPRAFGQFPFRGGAPRSLNRLSSPQLAPQTLAPQASGPKLGVQVKAIDADDPLRAHLRLDDGVGLLVETVVPGSLAETLKLERFDVITKINDTSIGEAADVAIVLKEAGGNSLEVHVIRRGKPLLLSKDA